MTKNLKLEQKRSVVTSTSTGAPRKRVSMKKFLIEKNAKNEAYFFILSHGLLKEFGDFCKTYRSDDPHLDCVKYLLLSLK